MRKRLLCVLLVFSMLSGLCTVVSFGSDETPCTAAPLIVISGFGTVSLYRDAGTDHAQKVFAPTTQTILKGVGGILLPTFGVLLTHNWDRFCEKADGKIFDVFETCICDADGNSVYNVSVTKFPLSADHYPEFYNQDFRDEQAFVKTAIETIGGDHTYFFSYDWRLDPLDHADALHEMVLRVKAETGHDKVVLAGCSMGGTILLSYLSKYGTDDVQTCIFDNAAIQGITFVGELFCLDLKVDKQVMIDYLLQFLNCGEKTKQFLNRLLGRLCLVDRIVAFAQDLLDNTQQQISRDVLYPMFGNMPGMWAFVKEADYERAKASALDPAVNAKLIERIDAYHYGVQCKAKELMQKALADGCNVFVLANYGKWGVPLTPSMFACHDYLIDTVLASGGAVCADNGTTLPQEYVQQVQDGHDHISSDSVIDASTCFLPEHTWFIKNMGHLDFPYGSEGAQLLMWLVQAKAPYTVQSDVRYPQFMVYDPELLTLSPQTK